QMADPGCGTCSVFLQVLGPPKARSGTITMSPGCRAASTAPPLNSPPLPPTTVPSARITKMAFLFAIVVGPPDCPKYQPALLPGLKVTAVGLYTAPSTVMKLGLLGMRITSPARTCMSAAVFAQRF